MFKRRLMALCGAMVLSISASNARAESTPKEESVVNLYSAQTENLIRPVLDLFTKETGITVNLITGGDAQLVTRLEQEGEHSPADLLLTADIGNIYQAYSKGLLQPITSDVLTNNVPEHLRAPDNTWFALTTRVRALYFPKDSAPDDISYLDLASDDWKGKVLIRSSSNVYNQSLMSYMIYHYGEEKALEWAKDVVANMARAPKGGDRDQMTALAAGEGGVAVGNTYYFGMLTGGNDALRNQEVVDKVTIRFPNQNNIGAHVNIRGGGVTAHAKHPANAVRLMEFLSEPQAQAVFAEANFEYPVNAKVPASALLSSWGAPKLDTTDLAKIGALQPKALELMDKAGWK